MLTDPFFITFEYYVKSQGCQKLYFTHFLIAFGSSFSVGNTLNVSDHKVCVGLLIFQQQWGRLQYFDSDLLHHAKQTEKTKQNHPSSSITIFAWFSWREVERGFMVENYNSWVLGLVVRTEEPRWTTRWRPRRCSCRPARPARNVSKKVTQPKFFPIYSN